MDSVKKSNLVFAAAVFLLFSASAFGTSATDSSQGRSKEDYFNKCSMFVEEHDWESTAVNLQNLLRSNRYDDLENALDCLLDQPFFFHTGEAGSSAAYLFYRSVFKPYNPVVHHRIVNDWIRYYPDSGYAQFALLRIRYDEAWYYRGQKSASNTSDLNFQAFKTTLKDGKDAVFMPDSALKDTPLSANLLLAFMLELDGMDQKAYELYNESVARWPDHHEFHRTLSNRLVPWWGGSWQTVEQFASYLSEQYKAKNGQYMYAMVYQHLHNQYKVGPDTTRMKWEKMRPALSDWSSADLTYERRTWAASYACLYNDMTLYDEFLLDGYRAGTRLDRFWVEGTDWGTCEAKRISAELD